jgi:MFS family permease
MFFWTVFDIILTYITPLILTEHGLSYTATGIIIGTSSIAGAAFDLLFCKIFTNANFRRIYMVMFALCALYPLILWQSKTIWLYVLAMIIWGIYYDLRNLGCFDFVGRNIPKEEHAASFGILQVFESLGVIVAPLITGLVIVEVIDGTPFILSWVFLGIAFVFFIMILMRKTTLTSMAIEDRHDERTTVKHSLIWANIIKNLYPILFLTFFLNLSDAFFWTIGPIFAESFDMHHLNGIFLTAYMLPLLLIGWFVGSITKKFGTRRTAFISLALGCLVLTSMSFVHNPYMLTGIVFIAGCFLALAWPAVNGAYADYISEYESISEDLEGIEDFSENIGYILGPISAGILADTLSIPYAFAVMGLVGCVSALLMLRMSLKKPKVSLA